MFSLQNLLRKEDRLLSLLEASALQARTSVQALVTARGDVGTPVAAQEVAFSRLKDRNITKEIIDEITSVPSIDREDIERLSDALYTIPKLADKFSNRVANARDQLCGIDFSRQLDLLNQASECLLQLVQSLKSGLDLKQVKALNEKLQSAEGEADKHMLTLYKDLYSEKYPAVQVIARKDLYELLEKLIDTCRDSGNIIWHIALAHS